MRLIRSLFQLTLILLFSAKGKAQQEPFLSSYDALLAIKSQRLQKNAHLTTAGRKVSWDQIRIIQPDQIDAFNASFTADSITWEFTIADENLAITFPNDISLVLGVDRSELQEQLLERFRHESNQHQLSGAKPDSLCDTLWVKTNSRYAFLSGLEVINPGDSLPVCCLRFPMASAVSAINDTAQCDGLFPMVLVHNRYGNKRDSMLCTMTDFIRITGASTWSKWFARDAESLVVLLQHPYLGFDHMLYLKPEMQNGAAHWNAELHAYIPSHNINNLYGTHNQKKGAERFIIK
ncbi:MAG: hypothetical protein ACK5B6_05445 [Bacteroidia bacterium]